MDTVPEHYACRINVCGHSSKTLRELINHMRLKHANDKSCSFKCSVNGCALNFHTVETYRRHVSIHHSDRWSDTRRTWVKAEPQTSVPMKECENETVLVEDPVFMDVDSESSVRDMYIKLMENLKKNVMLLNLNLEFKYGLSASAGENVLSHVRDMLTALKIGYDLCIKSQLEKSGLQDSELDFMLNDSVSLENCLRLTQSKEEAALKSLGYIAPERVNILDEKGNCDSLYYVPIEDTLKSYLSHEDVIESIKRENSSSKILDKYCNASLMDDHPLFSLDRTALRLILYTDEFGLTNPIGSHRKRHKMCGVYFSVNNVETKYASTLSSIHLALMAEEKTVKKHGYEKVMERMIVDLKNLEERGVVVFVNGVCHSFMVGVAAVLGDNLSSHSLGKFRTTFSSGRICRHCMALFSNIPSLYSEEQCSLRTAENHDMHVESVKKYPDLMKVYGVTGESALNALGSYHPIRSHPPDLMHDVYEGLMAWNVSAVIRGLVKTKVLTVQEINDLLMEFKYKFSDKINIHPGIPLGIASVKVSIGGTAAEKWNVFRLLSLIIGPHVPKDNPYWRLHLLCNEICDILLSPVILDDWPSVLKSLIYDHHKLWTSLPQDIVGSFKTKLHYIIHYPRLLEMYGPLRQLSCMRFEAFHLFFKNAAKKANNFVNIIWTICSKFQKKRCLEYAGYAAHQQTTHVGAQVRLSILQLPETEREVMQSYLKTDNAALTSVKCVHTFGHTFKCSEFLVIDVSENEDMPIFFRVDKIYLDEDSCFLYGKLTFAICFNRHLHAYVVDEEECDEDFCCISPSQVVPLQNLNLYVIEGVSYLKVRHTPVSVN